jgi:phage terminase small subunit
VSKKGLSPRKRRYARARARGESLRMAAQTAGATSRRARAGVTGSEWERDPAVVAEIQRLIEAEMTTTEMLARRAAQARGVLPTKTTIETPEGVRAEFDRGEALDSLMKAAGLFKDSAPRAADAGPGALSIEHRVAGMSDAELKAFLVDTVKVLGGPRA